MAELTRARGLSAMIGDIQALPFLDRSFDCVVANRVLYHVNDLNTGLTEIGRVLSVQGQLIAVTYGSHHLHELGQLVGQPKLESPFSAENGVPRLRQHFDDVERQDLSGNARFPDRASILQFLAAYGELADDDLSARLPELETPFDSTYRHTVFVARKRV
jgi:SAM-dependent methyltransferase